MRDVLGVRPNPRGGRALLALGVLAGCHARPPPPPYRGATVTVQAQVEHAPSGLEIFARTESGQEVALRPATADAYDGALLLSPGVHRLTVQGVHGGAIVEGPVVAQLALTAFGVGTLDVALSPVPGPALAMSAEHTRLGVGETVALHLAPADGGAVDLRVEPAACATLSPPAAGVVQLTARRAGACRVSARRLGGSLEAELTLHVHGASQPVVFPVRPAAGGRFLEDQRGVPFLLKGETAWLALVNLTDAEQEAYLADRAARGFNVVEVMLVNHDYTAPPNPVPPRNRAGEAPFEPPEAFAHPSDAYFGRARSFVDRAGAHGMAVLLAPNYLGFDGGKEGWWQALLSDANPRPVCFQLGRYLGAWFSDRPNVIWLAGGDFAPPPGSEGEARHWEILRGIQAAGAGQPWVGHWNFAHQGGLSTDQTRFAGAMALNGVYQYANVWKAVDRAYDVTPHRPAVLLESTYEHEHPDSNTQPFRKAWWWAALSGGAGGLWSNVFLWLAESAAGRHPARYGDTDHVLSSWREEWDSPGTHEVQNLHAFLEALPWQRLVPSGPTSGLPELVTSGQDPGQGHIAVALTPERDRVVAYVPPLRSGVRRFALDLSGMHGPVLARWYDPASGAFVHAFPVTPVRDTSFETPGTNASGWDDWVLLLEGG